MQTPDWIIKGSEYAKPHADSNRVTPWLSIVREQTLPPACPANSKAVTANTTDAQYGLHRDHILFLKLIVKHAAEGVTGLYKRAQWNPQKGSRIVAELEKNKLINVSKHQDPGSKGRPKLRCEITTAGTRFLAGP